MCLPVYLIQKETKFTVSAQEMISNQNIFTKDSVNIINSLKLQHEEEKASWERERRELLEQISLLSDEKKPIADINLVKTVLLLKNVDLDMQM